MLETEANLLGGPGTEALAHKLTALSCSTGAAVQKAAGTYGQGQTRLTTWRGLRSRGQNSSLGTEVLVGTIVALLNASSTQPSQVQAGAKSVLFISLSLFAPL